MLLGQSPYGVPQLNVADLTRAAPMGSFNPAQHGQQFPVQQPMAPQPYQWGQGGTRISPDQLALRQKLALQAQQSDYSPIQSPWQGLARVAQNVEGALDQKRLDKQDAAQQTANAAIIAELTKGDISKVDPGAVAAALNSGDQRVQSAGKDVFDKLHPKALEPTPLERLGAAAGLTPAQIQAGAAQKFNNDIDPLASFVYQGNTVTVPRSIAMQKFSGASGVPAPKSQAEYNALPAGTTYIDDDGKTKVKG